VGFEELAPSGGPTASPPNNDKAVAMDASFALNKMSPEGKMFENTPFEVGCGAARWGHSCRW
jgi:hypothetical protein